MVDVVIQIEEEEVQVSLIRDMAALASFSIFLTSYSK
jgi:hypothetical protein